VSADDLLEEVGLPSDAALLTIAEAPWLVTEQTAATPVVPLGTHPPTWR
jgi:hypothetical protein